uniref:Uncharacterized protein n=1 Tax=Chromera velia CCMP2878 TaxID=1169474 RepID=A0A0G4HLK5_9ALVE|mmetsp:Transcript_17683/g.35901  ORF Transcript_17683/g.35901 Transcript_17683/m.35901 type:complete len:99 (+) Transcript_17683:335-631(+)|eukprot:Cvel_28758.t1-p1 / transcript=Cvel_28758.t1 / gene=Cvel_28758 / organism=Chromera_velia_CCMP2878 / gene_product=hypothetical protein / transcript_product=hypothetical protein / location=Cvel_scaffold3825:11799-12092(-) / protein_length=98 / sequence_SO=supercontig / SO=protein_coding / is_pseudo=false
MAAATKDLAKELAGSFRWIRAFQKHKVKPPSKDPLSRYTNFTLQHVWEKYDCQTHLLLREAMVPAIAKNPELLDPDVDHLHLKYLSLYKAQSPAFTPK